MKYKPFALVSVEQAKQDDMLKENKYYTVITRTKGAKTARYIKTSSNCSSWPRFEFIATGNTYKELDVVSVFVEIEDQSGAVIFWPDDAVRTQEEAYKMHDAITRWSRGFVYGCDPGLSDASVKTVVVVGGSKGEVSFFESPKPGDILGDFLCVGHVHDERCLVPLADVRRELKELYEVTFRAATPPLRDAFFNLNREYGVISFDSLKDKQLYRYAQRLSIITKAAQLPNKLPSWLK